MFWNKQKNKTETKGLVALSGVLDAQWEATSPARLVEAGFRQNPVSYRCIRMVAETAASVPLREDCELCEADVAYLRLLLERPQAGETGRTLLEAVYGDLQVSGNGFLEMVRGADGDVAGIQRVPPAAVEPLKEGGGYSIRTRGGRRIIRSDASGWSPLLHLRALDPSARVMAMSPLEAAARAVEIHNAGSNWAKALIDNAARPSGALIYGRDGAHLTPDQFQRLKEQLEEAHSGARHAGRPMLLGIPGDNTYSNYREANLAFWRQTVLPLVQRTARALEDWMSGVTRDRVRLKLDLDAVPALAPEREALWNRLNGADFLSEGEKREIAGLQPREVPHAY